MLMKAVPILAEPLANSATTGTFTNFSVLQFLPLENGACICKFLKRCLCVFNELVIVKLSDVVSDAIYVFAD